MQFTLTVMGIFSLYLSIVALRSWLRDRKRSYVSLTGTIVEMERREKHDTVSFTPVYEYHYAGNTYRGKHRISSAKYGARLSVTEATKYPVGAEIPLLVDENEPSHSQVDDSTKALNPFSAVIFLAVAVFCFWFQYFR